MTLLITIINLIDAIIKNWQISLIVVCVFASLWLGLFKGIVKGLIALVVTLSGVGIAVFAIFCYAFIQQDWLFLVNFAIAWLPTLTFVLSVGIYTIVGAVRGLRKSVILLVHSIVAATICISLFFMFTTTQFADAALLNLINAFMGEGGLQNALSVSADCQTVREVLVEYVTALVSQSSPEIGILVQANSAYIFTLVDMAYRIVFSAVFFFVYLLLVFIAYILYHVFYSERKHKQKISVKFANGETDHAYHRRPVLGACVGLVRGLTSSLIALAFMGSLLYVATGGTAASKLPENVSFGEQNSDMVAIYRSIENYGEQGIFKVLNTISDPKDVPYYMFAADLVFSGGLDDKEHDVSGSIKFRQELASYLGFAKNTMALLLKYDADGSIATILGGGTVEGEPMDKILQVCSNADFKLEFNNLIDNFDSQTYVINFALSLADSVVANIDGLSFTQQLSADNKELLQLMFKRGYLCNAIPDERDRKNGTARAVSYEEPPRLLINHLLTKSDAQTALDIVLAVLSKEIDVSDPKSIIAKLLPRIENLSILSTERSAEVDPVLGRLYCYFDNKYLTNEGEDGITYAEIKQDNVEWTKEIRSLIKVADGVLSLYEMAAGEGNLFTKVTEFFDENGENYQSNIETYEELTSVIADSALIGKALSSSKIRGILTEQFKAINQNVYIPESIVYENNYDSDGNIVSHGEIYQLMRGLRLLSANENKEIVDMLLSQEENLFESLLEKLSKTITRDDPYASGNSLASYFTESSLLRSALSAVIMERAGEILVVPTLSLETDKNSNRVNLINKAELRQIFQALPEVCNLLLPLANGNVTSAQINDILNSKALNALIDDGNKIVEGTIAKSVIDSLSSNRKIIIPKKLESYEQWLTIGEPGELKKFLDVINMLDLDIVGMMDGGGLKGGDVFDKIKALDSESVEKLLSSGVFHYTASRMMDSGEFTFENFEVIVPVSSCTPLGEDEKLVRVIKKDELATIFIQLKNFGLSSDMDKEHIIKKLVERKDMLQSNVISASVVNFLVTNGEICSALGIPDLYLRAGERSNLTDYEPTNIWRKELPNMVNAIDEIFAISKMGEGYEFVFDGVNISARTNELLKTLNSPAITAPTSTKLDVCSSSDIIRNNITKELDKALSGVVPASVIAGAKADGYYSKAELRALSETADIFDLDILKIDNNELASKVKKEILTLNKPRANDAKNRTTLDIMYPSAIIRYFVTEEIDKALCGSGKTDTTLIDIDVRDSFKISGRADGVYPQEEISALVDALVALAIDNIDGGISGDKFTTVSKYKTNIDVICRSGLISGVITKKIDGALTEKVIENDVKRQIKGASKAYSAEQISALVTALDELSLSDFNEMEGIDFARIISILKDPSITDKRKTKLKVVYASDIAIGAFTKAVKDTFADSNGKLIYHPNANRRDLPLLKEIEIDALVSLLGGADLANFDVGDVTLAAVRTRLEPDSNGNPQSYLILANFTLALLKNRKLYVPSRLYTNMLITPDESLKFIDALIALQGDGAINDWKVDEDMVLPKAEVRSKITASEIMRATFSHNIFAKNGTGLTFARESVDISSVRLSSKGEQMTDELAIIDKAQLENLFNLISGGGGTELVVPAFVNIESIKNSGFDIYMLCEFDVTRYNISGIIINSGLTLPPDAIIEELCFYFTSASNSVSRENIAVSALTYDVIRAVLGL